MYLTIKMLVALALPRVNSRELYVDFEEENLNEYQLSSGEIIQTFSIGAIRNEQNIDVELRDLIALCQSTNATVPTLPYLLARCEDGVANRTLQDFDNSSFSEFDRYSEEDGSIQYIIRHTLLDADVRDAPQDTSRPTINTQVGTTLVGLFDSQYMAWSKIPPIPPENEKSFWETFNESINRMREEDDVG